MKYINSPSYRKAVHEVGEWVAGFLLIVGIIGLIGFLMIALTGELR